MPLFTPVSLYSKWDYHTVLRQHYIKTTDYCQNIVYKTHYIATAKYSKKLPAKQPGSCHSRDPDAGNVISFQARPICDLRGPRGGSEVDFYFLIASDRGECQLPRTFFGMEKYCPASQSYRIFKSRIFKSEMKILRFENCR